MNKVLRKNDVVEFDNVVNLVIDGEPVQAASGETILTTLLAINRKAISKNDYGVITGAFCGMGICYCCLIQVDGLEKVRACQTMVKEGMQVNTCCSRHGQKGGKYEQEK